jgi:hypothetical protein
MLLKTFNKNMKEEADVTASGSKGVLEPVERISEVLFGLIVVLTFTCTIKAKENGRVYAILVEALGCSLAWAIIDAGFYLLGRLSDRGHKLLLLRQLRGSSDQHDFQHIIVNVLPPLIAFHLPSEAFEALRYQLIQLPEPPARPRLTTEDWKGALGVFLFASAAILPIAIPFTFMRDAGLALLVSHGIAILLLFLAGWALGRYTSEHPLRIGFAMVAFGLATIAIALALGG